MFGFGKKNIIINGMNMTTYKRSYSYECICAIYYGIPNAHEMCPSITYQYPDKTHGMLHHGKSIKIIDGMIINIAVTGAA